MRALIVKSIDEIFYKAGGPKSHSAEFYAINFAQIKSDLDTLEARMRKDLREVLVEWRDGLVRKVTKAAAGDGLQKLAADLKLPRRGDFTVAVNEALRRAWEQGGKDARREVREGRRSVRELAFNPSQPRQPKGDPHGGEWVKLPFRVSLKMADQALWLAGGFKGEGNPSGAKGRRASVSLATLIATQDYLEPGKVSNMLKNWSEEKARKGLGLVVSRIKGKDFIVEGHHRLTVMWERGVRRTDVTLYEDKDATRRFDEEQEELAFAGTDSSFTPRDALRWLGEKAFWITNITGDKLLNEARGVILQSIKTGRPLGDTIIALAELFSPYIGDEDVIGDEKQTEPFRLETIVRTNTTDAYNHGRLTALVDPKILPFLKAVRYSAVLDERTTEVCRFLDGKLFRPGTSDLESLLPPNHFQCRSIIVPVVVGEAVNDADFITPAEIGTAKGLADARFLEERSEAHRHAA